jgi:hypothetical protein
MFPFKFSGLFDPKTQIATQSVGVPAGSTIVIQPPSSPDFWTILLPVIVGGILAIIGGFLGNAVPQWIQRRRDATTLAGAFRGEIGALLAIAERRHYQQGLEEVIQEVNAIQQVRVFTFSVRSNPFPVYRKNVSRIGMLPNPLPEMICQLYTQGQAILEILLTCKIPV